MTSSCLIASRLPDINPSRFQLFKHSKALMASPPNLHRRSEMVIFASLKTLPGSRADLLPAPHHQNFSGLDRCFVWGARSAARLAVPLDTFEPLPHGESSAQVVGAAYVWELDFFFCLFITRVRPMEIMARLCTVRFLSAVRAMAARC